MRRNRYFEHTKARIEIIPMIDIMMFLLVFFMVVTLKMIAGAGVKLDLPGMRTAHELPARKVYIAIDKAGVLVMDAKPLDPQTLLARLQALKAGAKIDVVIAADRETAHKHVMRVMDAARAAGIESIGIAARAEASAP